MCILRTLSLLWERGNSIIHVPHGSNVSLVNTQKKQEENIKDGCLQSVTREGTPCILNAYPVLPRAITAIISELICPVSMQP